MTSIPVRELSHVPVMDSRMVLLNALYKQTIDIYEENVQLVSASKCLNVHKNKKKSCDFIPLMLVICHKYISL